MSMERSTATTAPDRATGWSDNRDHNFRICKKFRRKIENLGPLEALCLDEKRRNGRQSRVGRAQTARRTPYSASNKEDRQNGSNEACQGQRMRQS
jgi:hypothetical protein